RSGSADWWVGVARTRGCQTNQVGAGLAFARAPALYDSYSWAFSVEFSVAAVFLFNSRDLCGRSVAPATAITDRGYSGAGSHRRYCHCDAHAAYNWLVRFPADVDLSWTRGVLVSLGDRAARF